MDGAGPRDPPLEADRYSRGHQPLSYSDNSFAGVGLHRAVAIGKISSTQHQLTLGPEA